MTITEQLFSKATDLIKVQPEVTDPTGRYSMADDGGVETDLGEFIYGLVRVLKPNNVLSTGVYTGISDMYIGQGLKDNGFGHLTAIEYEQTHLSRAERLWKVVGVHEQITGILKSSLEFNPPFGSSYDFMFLDSEPQIRYEEVERFFPFLNQGGFLGIHDCPRNMTQGNINPDHPDFPSWPFGNIPPKMLEWMKSGKMVKFHIPNPRGSVWFYKPTESDFIA